MTETTNSRTFQKWEYQVHDLIEPTALPNTASPLAGRLTRVLNKMGSEGWELISYRIKRSASAEIGQAIFKRPSST